MQLKGMLDLVERDVLQPAGLSFLRLDGGVEASERFNIVQVSVYVSYKCGSLKATARYVCIPPLPYKS